MLTLIKIAREVLREEKDKIGENMCDGKVPPLLPHTHSLEIYSNRDGTCFASFTIAI